MIEEGLEVFGSKKTPDAEIGWRLYNESVAFKTSINLFDTIKTNENFYVGKQWEGVDSNGLPTPTYNIIKRVANFIVATITSDNIKVTGAALANIPGVSEMDKIVNIVNDEFGAITERNNIPSLVREFTRNACVDGDGCVYTYWDDKAVTGQRAMGDIVSEIIENSRVHFGNPNDRDVQSQPWIMIERREILRKAKRRAKANGFATWNAIHPDDGQSNIDSVKRTSDKVTTILLLWRDEDTDEIWAYEFAHGSGIKEPWSLGIKLYPVVWLNWDYVQDSYHGQAMITGLIPNQVFINKAWAMSMLSVMRTAFPKYVYDNTRIKKFDNRVGGAIGVPGGDINNVAKVIDPAIISPQVSQLIELAVEQTEESLGATSVALGDTRPDNTSAIIALQRAAATPSEMTKQNLYRAIEDLYRIYLEFIGEYYGERYVDAEPTEEMRMAAEFVGMTIPAKVPQLFDFSVLKDHPMRLKLDVGASTYYSEIASMQTLDGLLRLGAIDIVQYLERISDDYVPKRRALIEEIKASMQQAQAMQAQMAAPEATPTPEGDGEMPLGGKPDIPTGGGFGALQRKVLEAGTTAGLV